MHTIASISTSSGTGGIGIIRISGENAFKIIEKIFVPKNNKEIKTYTIKYGKIVNLKTKKIIDEVLVSYFKAPKSYTGENVCEINSHGGSVVLTEILNNCISAGAELAEPGEFTKRAFLNGKMDLSQAEAVMDLINAKSKKEAEIAITQINGQLYNEISNIKNYLMGILVDINANIDYPEYDIEEITNKKIIDQLLIINSKLFQLSKSFERGKLIREGIKTIIIGKPNVGKSSFLNELLKEERAIVTEYEGTTRDTIEEFINIEGCLLKLIDTAGIRETNDEVEKIGINKALKEIEKADLVIAIFDLSRKFEEEDKNILEKIKNKKTIIILNKADIKKDTDVLEEIKKINKKYIEVSLAKREGIELIYDEIINFLNLNKMDLGYESTIINERHKALIEKALEINEKAIKTAKSKMSIDVIEIFIRDLIDTIGKITGETISEEIINEIFAKFCLGK